MKHFVYMNTDIINSYLSQINEGLLKSTVNEVADELATTKQDNSRPGKSSFTSEFGFKPIMNLKFTEDKDVMNTTNTLSQTESGRELIEKILHDNSLEQFINYLEHNNLISNIDNSKMGDYVILQDEFNIRDLDYLLNLMSDDFIDIMFQSSKEEAIALIEHSKINTPNTQIKNMRKKLDEEFNKQIKDMKNTRKIIDVARSIIPFSKYIICHNCIIPLTEKYLRDTTNNIRFTYSGKINIVGKYTSNLKDSLNREAKIRNEFDNVLQSIDGIIQALYKDTLGLDESMRIIIPIALYFE